MKHRSRIRIVSTVAGLTILAALVWFVPWSDLWAQEKVDSVPLALSNFDAPTYSSPIAMDVNKYLVWVVNPDDDTVSVIGNLNVTPSVIKQIGVGDEPQGIAIDTNNVDPNQYRVYVANPAENGITIIKVTASSPSAVTAVVEDTLVTGAEPWNVVASPDGKRIFVANSGQDTITVIRTDQASPAIVGNVRLDNSSCNVGDPNRHFQPCGMAVTSNSQHLYVTRFLSFTKTGGVQSDDAGKEGVVCQLSIPADVATLPIVVGPIALAASVTGFNIDSNGDTIPDATRAYPNQLQSIVIRGNVAYLPNIASSPSPPLRFNVDTQAFVNMIVNADTGIAPADWGVLNLHLGARNPEPLKKKLFFANPWAMAFTNQSGAGNAYVVSSGSDLLVKLNVDAGGVISFTGDISTTRYIDLNDPNNVATSGAKAGKNPLGIVIRNIAPGNNKAYVFNYISRNVSVVDLDTDAVVQVVQLTALPPAGTQEEQFQVGKEIFFSSRGHFDRPGGTTVSTDERLSSEGWQNCASCHFAALTDGTIWRFGSGPRKSVPLNATWSPQNPNDQRILNYSAIFDEVQDFELNIRNVSGPGALNGAALPPILDPNHGLIISDTGNINAAPAVVNAFALANAGRQQHKVTLPGSTTAWPALDAMKEWIRFNIRTPNGALTTSELTAGGGNTTGGLEPADVTSGRRLFFQAGCQKCHGGTKWTVSNKDFTSPPAGTEIATEADTNGATFPNPNGGQFLPRFLSDIGSFNLNGITSTNTIPAQPLIGGIEKDATGRDALGIDYDGNGKGAGFNIPALLGIWAVQPYYHNGACESLACVLANPTHRQKGRPSGPDILADPLDQLRVVAFLKTLDAETEFPFNLSVRSHDLFVDPPVVFKGSQVTLGANVTLFGVRSDLIDLGVSDFVVRFEFSATNSNINVNVPVSAFTQDFGTVAVTTTVNVPADAAATLSPFRVTVDFGDRFAETNENDNVAARNVRIRNAPSDRTPPQVISTFISDDTPFTDNDTVVQTNTVKIKIVAVDPPGNVPASGLKQFCIVSYHYDFVQRLWQPLTCDFADLPAPTADNTFIVDADLPAVAGVIYAFAWVRDVQGNVSRIPGFDFVSFVPNTPISLNRNDVAILRISLQAGQNLSVTVDLENGGFGDVDVSVFDDFRSATATRIALSARNGRLNEAVLVSGPGNRQIEIRAVVNSEFKITLVSTAQVAVDQPVEAAALAADEGISISGPPALRASIGEDLPDVPIETPKLHIPFVSKD